MANSRRKCRHCKAYGKPSDMLLVPAGAFCNFDCVMAYNRERVPKVRAKADKEKHSKLKRKFYDNDTKTRKAAAIREFNAYIRERDSGRPCISCWKPIPADDYCAGHYIPAGSNSRLRFDECNVNGQHNTDCNKYRSGDQVRYRIGLIAKYGIAEVERLESTNGTIKRRPQDYKAIEIKYREKRLALCANSD